MGADTFFSQAVIYLAAAVVSVPIAKRLGLGSVLGYLLAGIAIGPFAIGFIGTEGQDVMHFAEFGVVMMLFLIGLELQPALLWKMRRSLVGLGGLQVVGTTVVVGIVCRIVGLSTVESVTIGMVMSLSSTAIVIQTLNEKGLMKSTVGQGTFSVLLFQDIAVIPMLAAIPILAATISHDAVVHSADAHAPSTWLWIETLGSVSRAAAVFATMALVVVAGRFLVSPVFRLIARARLREIFTAAALLLVTGVALLMTRIGLSPALGAFLAGVVLAGSEFRHELEGDIEPFKGLLLGLFFIAVGASIDFGLIAERPLVITEIVLALIAVKLVVLLLLGRLFGYTLDNNLTMSVLLAQGGEFAFVLLSFTVTNGVLAANVAAPLVVSVAVSMAITPLLVIINERLILPRVGVLEDEARPTDAIDEVNPVIIAGFGRFGSIVGRLLRANGIGTTVLDHNSDHVDALRRLGMKVFYGDASREELLRAAGAEHAEVIVLSIDDGERILGMVETIHRHFPHLEILARATDRQHAYSLLNAGVDRVFRETFDSSLRLGEEALRMLGMRAFQSHRVTKKFRAEDEQHLRELAAFEGNRSAYFASARRRIEDLERTVQQSLEREMEHRDSGWDVTALREAMRDGNPED